jgi:hypothetical protein
MKSTGTDSTCVAQLRHEVLSASRTLPCGEIDSRCKLIAGRVMSEVADSNDVTPARVNVRSLRCDRESDRLLWVGSGHSTEARVD